MTDKELLFVVLALLAFMMFTAGIALIAG